MLFGQDLPNGTFQIGLYAQNPSDNDPGFCSLWCSTNIPGPSNGGNGSNYVRISDPQQDKLWGDVDTIIDPATRIKEAQQAQAGLADLIPALPIDPFPDIIVINSDKIGVAGGKFEHNFAYGPFTYLNTWFAK